MREIFCARKTEKLLAGIFFNVFYNIRKVTETQVTPIERSENLCGPLKSKQTVMIFLCLSAWIFVPSTVPKEVLQLSRFDPICEKIFIP